MADETTTAGDSAGESKPETGRPADLPAAALAHPSVAFSEGEAQAGALPRPSEALREGGAQAGEAHIVEEIIIKPAPTVALGPPPTVSGPALTAAPDLAPFTPSVPTSLFSSTVPSAPSVLAPPALQTQEIASSPHPPAHEEILPPVLPHSTAEFEKEREAISHILEEAKLPERRPPPGTRPSQEREPKTFDTTLGALPGSYEGGKDGKKEVEGAVEPEPTLMRAQEVPVRSAGLISSIVAPLRTLKNDLQEIVRVKKISLVRAAALESEKRHGRTGDLERESTGVARSRRTFGILFAAGLLSALGAAAFFGVYIIMLERSGVSPRVSGASILFAESTVSFPLNNSSSLDIKRLLAQARGRSSATLGSITRIVPTISETNAEGVAAERPVALEEFLKALGTRASPDLLRAFSGEFFFGMHTVDENAPLFVIPVLSYERAFAGMLSWEQTVNADLSPAFTPVPDQIRGAGGLPEKRRFEDVVMRNYDVRALKDDDGEIELYYSFPTKNILIIGESPYSFTEVLSRLRAERKL